MNNLKTTKLVDNDGLESLKQQAMKIALRLNVIQGGDLLYENANANAATPNLQRKLTTVEKSIMAAVLAITVGGSIAANMFDKPIIFLPVAVISLAYNIFVARKKNKRERAGVSA